jgi:hypothetical protein
MGTDVKRPTLILGTPEGTPLPSPSTAPRNALPPPPHIRRSSLSSLPDPDALDEGWDTTSQSALRPKSMEPTTYTPTSALPVVVRSSTYVPVSRSPMSPPPAAVPLTTPVSIRPSVPTSRFPQPLFLASSLPPPPPSSKKLFAAELEEIPSSEVVEDDDRPSDRVTVPNGLAPKKVVEVDVDSERSLATTRPPPPSHDRDVGVAYTFESPSRRPRLSLPHPDEAMTPSSLPPVSLDPRPPLTSVPTHAAHSVPVPQMPRQWIALFAATHVAVAASVLFWVYATRTEPRLHAREPHVALDDRMSLSSAAGAALENVTPHEGCRVEDLSRVIASHAELGPALDATALDSGFGVGLVSKSQEATGIRLEASTLRTAETVKVRSAWPVTRVAVDPGDGEDDRLDVRIDGNDTKMLGTQKITAQKGGIFSTDATGIPHLLWAIHGYVPKTETVRAVSRPDGSAMVALRRPGVMWIGISGEGAIVPVIRERKTLGTPTLAPTPAGGMVAWAERGASTPFSVLAARVEVDGKHTIVGEPETIAEGISPALAVLPSGELLLAYSDGKTGGHRVVAQRLAPDLTRRGDLLVLSSPGLNAGQPAIAVDGEGRAIVAYLAIENGRAEVHATAMSCR